MRRTWLLMSFVAAAGSACSSPPRVQSKPPPAKVTTVCDTTATVRARAVGLEREGRLDRALRTLNAADKQCPQTASESAALRRRISAALGGGAPALAMAEIAVRITQARAARKTGDEATAQRLYDQALHALRRRTGARETIALFGRGKGPAIRFDGHVAVIGTLLPADDNVVALLDPAWERGWSLQTRMIPTSKIEWSPGGLLVSQGFDLKLWRSSDAPLFSFPADAVFREDGNLAVGWHRGDLAIFDPATGAVTRTQKPAGFWMTGLDVRSNYLIVQGGMEIRFLDVYSLPQLKRGVAISGHAILVHPTRRLAVTIGDPETERDSSTRTEVVDLNTGKVTLRFAKGAYPESGGNSKHDHIHGWEPGGDRLAFLSGNKLFVLNVKTGRRFSAALGWTSPKWRGVYVGPVFTKDGKHACLSVNSQRSVVDLTRGTLVKDTSRTAYRCLHHGRQQGVFVSVPLRAGFALERGTGDLYPSRPVFRHLDVVVSDDRKSAAAVIFRTDKGATERELLILDLATASVRFRIPVDASKYTHGHRPQISIDNGSVAVWRRNWRDDKRANYDLHTGVAVPYVGTPDKDAGPVPAYETESPVQKLVGYGSSEIHGPTWLATAGGDGYAWDLKSGRALWSGKIGCAHGVSENGHFLVMTPPCRKSGPLRILDLHTKKWRTVEASPHNWLSRPSILAVSNDGEHVAMWRNGAIRGYAFDPADLTMWKRSGWERPAPASITFSEKGELRFSDTKTSRRAKRQTLLNQQSESLAELLMVGPLSALAFFPDGRIDWIGDKREESRNLLCRVGLQVIPFDVCAERWTDQGAVSRALSGDTQGRP